MPDPASGRGGSGGGDDGAAPAPLDAACRAFWRFSCVVYGRPGIADTLLALQEEAGADVNLALLCLWLGLCGKPLDAAALAAAERAAEPVQAGVLRPLRTARRGLKALGDAAPAALYREAKNLELAVEQIAQRLLLAGLPPEAVPAVSAGAIRCAPADTARASANLAAYAAHLRVDGSRMEPLLDAGRKTFRLSDD